MKIEEPIIPSNKPDQIHPSGISEAEKYLSDKAFTEGDMAAASTFGRSEMEKLNRDIAAARDNVLHAFEHTESGLGNSVNKNSPESDIFIKMDDKKFERLQVLSRLRQTQGFLSLGEEKEYAVLNSEFHTAYNYALKISANTPPAPIIFQSPVEIFNENDVQRWADGAQKFREFYKVAQDDSMREKLEAILDPVDMNLLKALFLGEKPVVLLRESIDPNDPHNAPIIDLLKNYGVSIKGGCLYDQEQVKNVMKIHENYFKTLDLTDPDKVIALIDTSPVKNHFTAGILLGFPIESVKKYAEEEATGIKSAERKAVSVYGNSWTDFNDSLESKIKQARLKAAFERSGILKI